MEQNRIEPIDIILVTYERLNLLKKTVEMINKRTLYPYNLIVVDSGSTDGTRDWLKMAEKYGMVQKRVYLEENLGLPMALNEGYKHVKSEFFITTQDDLLPPELKPCWLERMVYLAKKYPDYAGLFMRIQRTARLIVDEDQDLIESPKSCASVFRIQRRDDFKGKEFPFGTRKHWESPDFAETARQLKKKTAMTTKLYADHTGYMVGNKGYVDGKVDYYTYSPQRVNQGDDKPYPDIDARTQYPKKINHPYDTRELDRIQRWLEERGANPDEHSLYQQDVLGQYCNGVGLDIGCGPVRKCHPDAIGVDINPYSEVVDIVNDGSDLWMFEDNSLDYIVGCHSLEHFPDTHKVLDEWFRVLRIGGYIALIVPDAGKRPNVVRAKGHKTGFTKDMLYHYLKGKFKLIRCEELERTHDNAVLIAVGLKRG